MRSGGLAQLFPSKTVPLIATDSPSIVKWAAARGLKTCSLLEVLDSPPDEVILAVSNYDEAPSGNELRDGLSSTRYLYLPLDSFDGGHEASEYTFSLLFATDFVGAATRNARLVHSWTFDSRPLIFRSVNGTNLECALGGEITATTRTTLDIELGTCPSAAEWFEVSVSGGKEDLTSNFLIQGQLVASGMLVARDVRLSGEGLELFREACRLRDELMSAGATICLEIENSAVRRATTSDGADITSDLLRMTTERYGMHILEFACGTNTSIADRVNWRYNSQLNEGCGGIHLGFGEGVTCPHIDFVCPGAIEFTTSSSLSDRGEIPA